MAFPVQTQGSNLEILKHLNEGLPMFNSTVPMTFQFPSGWVYDGTGDVATTGEVVTSTGLTLYSKQCPITKITVIEEIKGFSSAPMQLTYTCGYNKLDKIYSGINDIFSEKPYYIVKPKETATIVAKLQTPVTNSRVLLYGGIRAYRISADINYTARKTIWLVGDSNMEASAITNSSSQPTLSANQVWTWKLRDWYRSNGNDVRLIDCSWSGETAATFEWLKETYLNNTNTIEPSLIIYNLGTNDSVAATVATNTTNFVNYCLGRFPNARILVIAPVNAENSTRQTLNQSMASLQVSAISNIANDRVFFINPLSAYSPTDSIQYSGTESVGNGIHMSVTGHASLYNYVVSQITAHDATSYVKFAVL